MPSTRSKRLRLDCRASSPLLRVGGHLLPLSRGEKAEQPYLPINFFCALVK